MPAVVNQPTVTTTTGLGVQSVRNPLYRYTFQNFPLNPTYFPTDSNVAGDAWLAKYPYTVRGAPDYLNSPSDPNRANNALLNSNLKGSTVCTFSPEILRMHQADLSIAVLCFGEANDFQRIWNHCNTGYFN